MVNFTNPTTAPARPSLRIEEVRRQLAEIESKIDELSDIKTLFEYPDQDDINELDEAYEKLYEKRALIYQRLREYARSLADEWYRAIVNEWLWWDSCNVGFCTECIL